MKLGEGAALDFDTWVLGLRDGRSYVSDGLSHLMDFEVGGLAVGEPGIEGATQRNRIAFLQEVDELERNVTSAVSALDEFLKQTESIKQTLMRSTADAGLYGETQELEKTAKSLRARLAGHSEREFMNEPGPTPIDRRLYVAGWGDRTQAHGPTQTQRESLGIAKADYAEVREELERLFYRELPRLHERLDEAGVPWTPGRTIPASR